NGAVHQIRGEREAARRALELMDRREAEWLERRELLRGTAPRVQLEQPVGAVPPPTSAPTPATAPPPPPAPAPTPNLGSHPGHKPARKLSAAALLGVSGASLVILAAIVFVAASWDTYIPIVRAGFLIAFAGFFAW